VQFFQVVGQGFPGDTQLSRRGEQSQLQLAYIRRWNFSDHLTLNPGEPGPENNIMERAKVLK
jgi:hypothetical protein